MTTNKVLAKVNAESMALNKQIVHSDKELNDAISFLSASVGRIGELMPKRNAFLKKNRSYDGLSGTIGRIIPIALAIIGYLFTPILGIEFFDKNGGINLGQLEKSLIVIGVLAIGVCGQMWSNTHNPDIHKMVETLEEKGKLNPVKSFLMRLFLNKAQWARLDELSSEIIDYHKAINAWEQYMKDVQFSEEFENALGIVNKNSPRLEIYRNIRGGLSSRQRNLYESSAVEANLRDWITN